MTTSGVIYDKALIESTIAKVMEQFSDKIERIRYNIGQDWAGEPALFFRVLLNDHAVYQNSGRVIETRAFADVAALISDRLREAVNESDVFPYFSFRTVSEQNELLNEEWQ